MPRDELLWHCLHRLVSIVEMKHTNLATLKPTDSVVEIAMPTNVVRQSGKMEPLTPNEFVCKNIFRFICDHYGSRCKLGYDYMEYSLREGTSKEGEIMRITYNTTRQAIFGQQKSALSFDKIFLSVGLWESQNENITLEYIRNCIAKLKGFIDDMQAHFDSNGSLNGFVKSGVLRI